ncbi:unnamed protein product [Thelazia callipaeda]|uniref:ATPase_AAA_core domain-containing protein n=1 Tax=Thelazia callipaeda TaxID=103827 RepID=A0A0N5D470_THECL|nr:unnamed protein product [Thelazia callipaeda]
MKSAIKLIVQKLVTTLICSSFAVELSSVEDWNIVLITVGQNSNRIKSSMSEDASKGLPVSFLSKMESLYCDIKPSSFLSRIEQYCGDANTNITARVLPETLINDDFYEKVDVLAVFMLTERQNTVETITLSAVSNCLTNQIAYALFIELPVGCSRFAAVQQILKQYHPHHCLLSRRLYQLFIGEYEWIKISFLPKNHIRQLEILEVLSEEKLPSDFGRFLQDHLWKTHENYPFIVPRNGIEVEINLSNDTKVQCIIRPRLVDERFEKCFLIISGFFPLIEYLERQSMDVRFRRFHVKASIQKAAINFGGWKSEIIEFSYAKFLFVFQVSLIERLYNYIMYHFNNSIFSSARNLLMVGAKSTGKTSMLHLLAKKLLYCHLVVYSEYITCSDWSTKAPEKFEDLIKTSAGRLKHRLPSILFLDNLDYLLHDGEEGARNLHIEKCIELHFLVLRKLASEDNFLVLATSCSNQATELFTRNGGKRFFGCMEKIEELGAVSC